MFKTVLSLLLFAGLLSSAYSQNYSSDAFQKKKAAVDAAEAAGQSLPAEPVEEKMKTSDKLDRGMVSVKYQKFRTSNAGGVDVAAVKLDDAILYEPTYFKEIGMLSPKWKEFSVNLFALFNDDNKVDKIRGQLNWGGLVTYVETGKVQGSFVHLPGRTENFGSSTGDLFLTMLPSSPTFESEVRSYKIGYQSIEKGGVAAIMGLHYINFSRPTVITVDVSTNGHSVIGAPQEYIDAAFETTVVGIWIDTAELERVMHGQAPVLSLFHSEIGNVMTGISFGLDFTLGMAFHKYGDKASSDFLTTVGRPIELEKPSSSPALLAVYRAGWYFVADVHEDYTLGFYGGVEGELNVTSTSSPDPIGSNSEPAGEADPGGFDGIGLFAKMIVSF